jgi:hypothetical protein
MRTSLDKEARQTGLLRAWGQMNGSTSKHSTLQPQIKVGVEEVMIGALYSK